MTYGHWFRWAGDTLHLEVAAQPGTKREGVNGVHGGRLRVRINARAVEGKANRQLLSWLAEEFGVAGSRVRLLRGERGRSKSLAIAAPQSLPAWFTELGGK